MALRAIVLTVSDKGSRGEREDLSGPALCALLQTAGIEVVDQQIVPDEADQIQAALIAASDAGQMDLVLTTGGTGVSPRDVTPDATRTVIEREIPGMAEEMRRSSIAITPHAMISRAIVGIRGKTLIINLPGSPKGARENLSVLLPALNHTIAKINGDPQDCAS